MKSISTILASMAILGCTVANAQAPGGVSGATLWLKADAGVHLKGTTDTVQKWDNFGVAGGAAGQLGLPTNNYDTTFSMVDGERVVASIKPFNIVLPYLLNGDDNNSGFNYNPGFRFVGLTQFGDSMVSVVPNDPGEFGSSAPDEPITNNSELEYYQVYTLEKQTGGKLFGLTLKEADNTVVTDLPGTKNIYDWNGLRASSEDGAMGSLWSYGEYHYHPEGGSVKTHGATKNFKDNDPSTLPSLKAGQGNITRVAYNPAHNVIDAYNNGIIPENGGIGFPSYWIGNGGYSLGDDRTIGGDDNSAERITAEVIAFPKRLGDNDRLKIQSYLAVKYGFTLPQDYIASDATTKIWDATLNEGYNSNITSIGRDDASELEQKQSVSINKQNDGNYTIISLGDALATNNKSGDLDSVTNDKSFFTFGDNGVEDIAATQTESIKVDGFNYTLKQRVWKVQKANWADQDITLTVNPEQTTKPVAIIIASDANFTEDVQVIDLTNGAATFNSSELPDGYYFTYADSKDVVTPVTFASELTAKAVNSSVQLTWATATEVNNSGFAVQRSSDAHNFVAVDFVATKATNGNSTSAINYHFSDNNLAAGTYYYRLAQTDRNGKAVNTEVVAVTVNVNGTENAVVLYPNPVQTTFKIKNAIAGAAYRIVNLAGQNVQAGILSGPQSEINVGKLAAGIYYVELSKDGQTTVKLKFVKQ